MIFPENQVIKRKGEKTIMGSIDTAFHASKEMREGLGVLSQDEWLRLCAFTDEAIYFKPSTEKMLRAEINLPDSEPLLQEFRETIAKYVRLKQYCQTFEDEINPETRELASSIIQYARDTANTYDALRKAVLRQGSPAEWLLALNNLVREWQSSHPSPDAQVALGDFQRYVAILKADAQKKEAAAKNLHTKMKNFHENLKSSNKEFLADAQKYQGLFGENSPKVKRLKNELDDLQNELNGLRKHEDNMVLVLETAPFYLMIPIYGPFIMSGVLLSVGTALGALRNTIYSKIQEAVKVDKELGPMLKFMALYEYGQKSTAKTAEDIKAVLPLVEKLKTAWTELTSNLTELSTKLLEPKVLTGAWDLAALNVDTAKATWQDLKILAEKYLRFQLGRADELDEAMKGVVLAEKTAA
jgi:hypothetical protein